MHKALFLNTAGQPYKAIKTSSPLRSPNTLHCQRRRSHILHIASEPRAVSKGGMEPFEDYKVCRGGKELVRKGQLLAMLGQRSRNSC